MNPWDSNYSIFFSHEHINDNTFCFRINITIATIMMLPKVKKFNSMAFIIIKEQILSSLLFSFFFFSLLPTFHVHYSLSRHSVSKLCGSSLVLHQNRMLSSSLSTQVIIGQLFRREFPPLEKQRAFQNYLNRCMFIKKLPRSQFFLLLFSNNISLFFNSAFLWVFEIPS